MNDLEVEAERIKRLSGRHATRERRDLISQALSSKWEGTQALAIAILAEWGDRQSIQAIQTFLEAAFTRKYGWAIRGVAIRALAPALTADDSDWLGRLSRSPVTELKRHELRPLIERLAALKMTVQSAPLGHSDLKIP